MTFRLISDFNDYYDAMFHAYGYDPKKVWSREHTEVNYSRGSAEYRRISDAIYDAGGYRYTGRYIGVAGTLYQFFVCSDVNNPCGQLLFPGYNQDKVDVDRYINNLVYLDSGYWRKEAKSRVERFKVYCDRPHNIVGMDKLFKAVNSPIIYLHSHDSGITITGNPVLSEFGFGCVKTGFEVFQEVEQYLESELMVVKERGEVADKYKLLGHGFDDKSFKNR